MSGFDTKDSIHPDGTATLLYALAETPKALVWCSLGESSPAVAVFHTPSGCVARPHDKFQALCPHHIYTDGMIQEGVDKVIPLLDLTLEQRWSREAGLQLPLRLGFTVRQLEVVLWTLPGIVVP